MYRELGSTGIMMYDLLGIVAIFVLLFFNLWHYKEKSAFLGLHMQKARSFFAEKMPRVKFLATVSFWAIIETCLVSFFEYSVPGRFNVPFGRLIGTNANYFGLLYTVPFVLLIFCILMRIQPLRQIDLVTPALPLALVFAKLACFCGGCCWGIECSFGLYNYRFTSCRVEFPVQLVEAGLALAIFVFLLFWRKKAKPGTMFPTYLILYSATRFFSEFLRHEPNVLWIFKTYQILCIIGVILGVVQLLLVRKFGDRIERFDLITFFSQKFVNVKMRYYKRKKKR